jgi:hypothetical protein
MKSELENYDAPEEQAEDVDVPESSEPQDDADGADDAYREFLRDRRTIRYEDNASNRGELFDYLSNFSPSLPETPAALFLAFDELCKDNKLELIPLAPPKSPDMRTAGEVQAEEAERAEPESQSDIAKDARALLKTFRKGSFARYKNGALVS